MVIYRDTDVELTSPFETALWALQQTPHVRRINLGGLSTDDVAKLIVEHGEERDRCTA